MFRRTLLFTSAIFFLLLHSSVEMESSGEERVRTDKRVVIVGAGMAGIAAARYIANHSNMTVILLEANPERYGGRIWTFQMPEFPGKPVELGAMWLHGGSSPKHPVAEICREQNIPSIRHEVLEPSMLEVFDMAGRPVSLDQLTYVRELSSEAYRLREKRLEEGKADVPFLAAFKQMNPGMYRRLTSLPIIKNFGIAGLESYHGCKIEDLSLFFGDGTPNSEESQHELETYDDLVLPDGYSAVLDFLIKDGRPFHLHLDHKVVEIDSSGEGVSLRVRTTDQLDDVTMQADHVIVAVPLGVLKKRDIRFVPELSPEHQIAIERIGFGNVVKVLLVFDRPFWSDKEHIGVETSDPSGFPTIFVNLQKLHALPALLAMISGKGADLADTLNEREIALKLMEVLSRIYGSINVTMRTLNHVKVTRWKADPLFQGVYSYGKYGMTVEDTYNVRQSVDSKVFFAGEYTEFPTEQHGMVHGAYESGLRAAKQIVAQTSSASKTLKSSLLATLMTVLALGSAWSS